MHKNAFNYSGDHISINHLLIQLKIWAEANLPVWSYCSQRSPIARAEAWGQAGKKCAVQWTQKKKNNHKTKTEKRVKVQLGRIYVVQFANRKLNNLHSILDISAMSIIMQPKKHGTTEVSEGIQQKRVRGKQQALVLDAISFISHAHFN